MSDTFGRSLNRSPPGVKAWVKRELKAGEALAFSVVDDAGGRDLSHTIRLTRSGYNVTGHDGENLGSFVTLARATAQGFAASAEALQHGL